MDEFSKNSNVHDSATAIQFVSELIGRGGLQTSWRERDWRALRHLSGRRDAHADWRSYYDDETRAAVGALYARDVALFGYACD